MFESRAPSPGWLRYRHFFRRANLSVKYESFVLRQNETTSAVRAEEELCSVSKPKHKGLRDVVFTPPQAERFYKKTKTL